jgi:DNA-binding MarR family transcriptional regulator
VDRADAVDRYLQLRPLIRARMEATVPDELRAEFADVTPHQMRALLALGGDGVTMGALAEAMGVSKATASVLGDRLVALELADRCPDPADRRRVRLVPTARGRSLALRGLEVQRRAAATLFARLSDPQVEAWLDVLETLAVPAPADPILEGAR